MVKVHELRLKLRHKYYEDLIDKQLKTLDNEVEINFIERSDEEFVVNKLLPRYKEEGYWCITKTRSYDKCHIYAFESEEVKRAKELD